MTLKTQKTDDLINSLSNDLSDIKLMAHPMKRVVPWFIIAIIYLGGVVSVFDVRSDSAVFFTNANSLFELTLVACMSASAAVCAAWLCIPDMRGQKWMIGVPTCLFVMLALWLGLKVAYEPHNFSGFNFHKCITEGIIFGLIPAIFLILLTVKGKTTRPVWLAFMNAASIGGVGYIGLRITCASNDVGHVLSYHVLPYIVFGVIISLIARRIYRW